MGRKKQSFSNLPTYDVASDMLPIEDMYTDFKAIQQMSINALLAYYNCQLCNSIVDMSLTRCTMHKNDKIVCFNCFKR